MVEALTIKEGDQVENFPVEFPPGHTAEEHVEWEILCGQLPNAGKPWWV